MDNHKKRAKKRRRWPFLVVFLLGLGVLAYPLISQFYYRFEATTAVQDFESERNKLDQEEIDRRMALAHAFNESLISTSVNDPYAEEHAAGRAEYARMLELNERMGHVMIPKLNLDLPMYAGTSEEVLQKGIGHLEGTSLPVGGNSTHSVLTAHRGLPTARLFTDLDQLVVGDKFYVHNISGVLAYQVDQIKAIDPSNFDDLLVVPGHDYVTLLTCTPYMINSHRLLVRGHQVDYVAQIEEKAIEDHKAAFYYKYAFFITLALLLIAIIAVVRQLCKNAQLKRSLKTEITPPEKEASVYDNTEKEE